MRLSLHGEYLARSPVADTDRLWRHTASRAKVQWFCGTFSLTDATNCNHVCREHNACVRCSRGQTGGARRDDRRRIIFLLLAATRCSTLKAKTSYLREHSPVVIHSPLYR